MSAPFTDAELALLRLVQDDLPDSATPFADAARQAGSTEAEALALLRRLRDDGTIRRFGATLRHQTAGWSANVMAAWRVDPGQAEEAGQRMAEHPRVSHCYLRRADPRWPRALFTMIHGRHRDECLQTVEQLMERTGLSDVQLLFSVKELKKTSMTYF